MWQTTRCLVAWKVHWREKRTINEEWSMTIPRFKSKCRTRGQEWTEWTSEHQKRLKHRADLFKGLVLRLCITWSRSNPAMFLRSRGGRNRNIFLYVYNYIICIYIHVYIYIHSFFKFLVSLSGYVMWKMDWESSSCTPKAWKERNEELCCAQTTEEAKRLHWMKCVPCGLLHISFDTTRSGLDKGKT